MRVLISVDALYAPAPISELAASYVAKRPSILEVTEGCQIEPGLGEEAMWLMRNLDYF